MNRLTVEDLARELTVEWDVIVVKCRRLGVPNVVNEHSPVSEGLAATIREWYYEGELREDEEDPEKPAW